MDDWFQLLEPFHKFKQKDRAIECRTSPEENDFAVIMQSV